MYTYYIIDNMYYVYIHYTQICTYTILHIIYGAFLNGGTLKWMVYFMENPSMNG